MRVGVLLLLLCCFATSMARADDWFVSNTQGDDLNDGTRADPLGGRTGPFRTIARALRSAVNGDRIAIQNTGEPYRESITLQADRHSGITGSPFVIEGNGAILDGTEPVLPDAWEHYENEVYRFSPERKSFHLLYLNGKPAKRRQLLPDEDGIPELKPLEWCLYQGRVYFRTEPGKLPWAYELTHTVLPVGLTLYQVYDVVVQDLIVQGFVLDGLNAHDGVVDAQFVGLTCRGNGRSGISVGGASRVTLEACLIGDNGSAQVRAEGYSHALIVNCDLIDHPEAPALEKESSEVVVETRVAEANAANRQLR